MRLHFLSCCLWLALATTACDFSKKPLQKPFFSPPGAPAQSGANVPTAGRQIRISAEAAEGEIVISEIVDNGEAALSVSWFGLKGVPSTLWSEPYFIIDPDLPQPWFMATRKGVPYLALSVFSGGAKCCWELLIFRLDQPSLVTRGFASASSPIFTSLGEECPLAAAVLPVSTTGGSGMTKIECLLLSQPDPP